MPKLGLKAAAVQTAGRRVDGGGAVGSRLRQIEQIDKDQRADGAVGAVVGRKGEAIQRRVVRHGHLGADVVLQRYAEVARTRNDGLVEEANGSILVAEHALVDVIVRTAGLGVEREVAQRRALHAVRSTS